MHSLPKRLMDKVLGIMGFEEEMSEDEEKNRGDHRYREEEEGMSASKRKG